MFDVGNGFVQNIFVAADPFDGFIPVVAKASRVMPVLSLGIVESELESLFLTGVSKFLHDVAAKWRLVNDVVLVVLRTKHRKAIVMLGCDDDVFHAGTFGAANEFISVKFRRIELFSVLLVFRDRNLAATHHPFRAVGEVIPFVLSTDDRVDTPVNEHAKLCFTPPSHPCVAIGFRFDDFGFNLVLCGRNARAKQSQDCESEEE